MTLTLKPKALKEQRAKRHLAPLELQKEVHDAGPQAEWRTWSREGIQAFAVNVAIAKVPHLATVVRDAAGDDEAGDVASEACASLSATEANGLTVRGSGIGLHVLGPDFKEVARFTYAELVDAFRWCSLHSPVDPAKVKPRGKKASPDETGTTTPAGIAANDPEAVPPAKATGKRLIEMSDAELQQKCNGVSPEREAYASLVATRFTLGLFQRHPDNRQPAAAEVTALAADLKIHQQREPVLARQLAGGKLQILWGEKRWLAAKEAGLEYLWARVIECDDRRALELVAQGNAQRSDFNPIEKAQLIEKLCQAGKTREQAAADVGLESGSAASNLVRLLRLPKEWRERVASGELPESWARIMTPYTHIPALMKEFEKAWKRGIDSRSHLEQTAKNLVRNLLRDPREKRWFGDYPKGIEGNHYARQFEITPELKKKLGFTTLEVTENGKPVTIEVACNVSLYDKLQEAALWEKAKARTQKKAKAVGKQADAGEAVKPKTKAELEHARKVRAEQLGRSIAEWKDRIVRREIAAAIGRTSPADVRLWKLAVTCLFEPPSEPHYDSPGFAEVLAGLVYGGGRKEKRQSEYDLVSHNTDGCPRPLERMARLGGLAAAFVAQAITDGHFWEETIDRLFTEWQCDLEAAWRSLFTDKAPELEEFFEMHRKNELQELGKELGVHLADNLGKPQMLKILLNRTVPLPLPACLAPPKPKRKKGAK